MLLRIKHKVIFYHWRDKRSKKPTKLAICSCGWKSNFYRKPIKKRLRQFICKHQWDKWGNMHCGPVGFIESEDTYAGSMRMCGVCYKAENKKLPWEEAKKYELS